MKRSGKTGWFTWLVTIAFIAFGIAFCVSDKSPPVAGNTAKDEKSAQRDAELAEARKQRQGQERIRAQLRDEGSAEFRNAKGYCGEVNAKNAYGASAGFVRYVAPNDHMSLIEGQAPQDIFDETWNAACK
ncbi:hypothetical protein [Pseudomonas sp. UBA6323]|uniref:hypothetical protein n=1 Tax=Pseudomonas sp. UBA6323 TaxID=1947329 RepID=UPI0025F7CEF6|nr:hypothetical protein [Pseudomonas sp. UBA6323]